MFDLHLAGDSKQSKNMKRKDVSEGAASSDDVLPKKKKTTDSMDSGVLQSTEIQVRIIVAEWVDIRTHREIIY